MSRVCLSGHAESSTCYSSELRKYGSKVSMLFSLLGKNNLDAHHKSVHNRHRPKADMRYFADAADAVCVKNDRLCVKFMSEFTRST